MGRSHITQVLERIRKGVLDPSDTAWLEKAPADRLVEELRSSRFRVVMQERRIGKKWEISLAQNLRAELTFRPLPDAAYAPGSYVPIYIKCLMLNGEDNRFTGISTLTRLMVWAVSEPERSLALRTGQGHKLDKTPAGWAIKPLHRRTVKLSRSYLQKRGWRLNQVEQFIHNYQ